MSKDKLIEKLERILEVDQISAPYKRECEIKDWENYGKSRTYFKLVETCSVSKHYKTRDYGYYDNINNQYVPGRYNLEADKIYGFGGSLLAL